MENSYIQRLKTIQDSQSEKERKERFRKKIQLAESGRQKAKRDINQDVRTTFDPSTIYLTNEEKIGYAVTRMRNAIKTGSLYDAFDAFEIYVKIGRGGTPSVLNGLLKTYQTALNNPKSCVQPEYARKLEGILQKYGPEAEAISERRRQIPIRAASIIGLIGGIFFLFSGVSNSKIQLSPNAVAPFNWQLYLGIVLVLIGLVAGFFWKKSKNKKSSKKR